MGKTRGDARRSGHERASEVRRFSAILAGLAALAPATASAGVYKSMEDYVHGDSIEPFAITHSPGYNGAGGLIQMRICVEDTPASRPLVGPLQAALKMWNALLPRTGNCGGIDICQ